MTDDGPAHRFLWWWTLSELLLLVGALAILVSGFLGRTALLVDLSPAIRFAALAFVALELVIPLWVYLDLRRRPDDVGEFWVHVAAMPLLNLVGLLAYLEARRATREA